MCIYIYFAVVLHFLLIQFADDNSYTLLSLLHTSDVSANASAIATIKSSVKREKRDRKLKKKEKFVFLVLVLRLRLRLCQKSTVKRQNVSARYEPPCLCRLCSSVKVLALAIAIVLTSLV